MGKSKDFIKIYCFKSLKKPLLDDTQRQVQLKILFSTDHLIELKTFDPTLVNAHWTILSINFSQDRFTENTIAILKEHWNPQFITQLH